MVSFFPQDRPTEFVLERHLSVKAAADCFGHNEQTPLKKESNTLLQCEKMM